MKLIHCQGHTRPHLNLALNILHQHPSLKITFIGNIDNTERCHAELARHGSYQDRLDLLLLGETEVGLGREGEGGSRGGPGEAESGGRGSVGDDLGSGSEDTGREGVGRGAGQAVRTPRQPVELLRFISVEIR